MHIIDPYLSHAPIVTRLASRGASIYGYRAMNMDNGFSTRRRSEIVDANSKYLALTLGVQYIHKRCKQAELISRSSLLSLTALGVERGLSW